MIALAHRPDPGQTADRRPTLESLTPAQERFGERNGASPGHRSLPDGRMVFFYREGPMLTRRWLVDPIGRTVDFETFARTSEQGGHP